MDFCVHLNPYKPRNANISQVYILAEHLFNKFCKFYNKDKDMVKSQLFRRISLQFIRKLKFLRFVYCSY